MKKIVLGAAAAAMAMSAIGITASAVEKHPGESGCCYVNEYGKHPGESGFCYSDAEKTASDGSFRSPFKSFTGNLFLYTLFIIIGICKCCEYMAF